MFHFGFSYYLGAKTTGDDPGDPVNTVFEIRRMQDHLIREECWGREHYCRGTPVLFTPYSGVRDVLKDLPVIVPHVVCQTIRSLRWGITSVWSRSRAYAFLMGMREFRSDMTMNFDHDYGQSYAYDLGREWAHRLTFRHWDYA
jgi:hypothetical protein